jgi:hypothetical protein
MQLLHASIIALAELRLHAANSLGSSRAVQPTHDVTTTRAGTDRATVLA